MSEKKKPSGAEFRKRANQKTAQEENFLKKVPRISSFFNVKSDTHASQQNSNDNHVFKENVESPNNLPQNENSESCSTLDNLNSAINVQHLCSVSESSSPSTSCAHSHSPNKQNQGFEEEIGLNPFFKKNFDFTLDDPATWDTKNDEQVLQIIHSNVKQDLQVDFSKSERHYYKNDVKKNRRLSANLFSGEIQNGERFKRDWLLYSKSTGCVFCIPCLLFQPENKRTSFCEGFSDWKHSFALAKSHEQSNDHRINVFKLISRKKTHTVESLISSQHEKEVKYWRDVLTRIVTVVKFLAVRGLPFRGDNQELGSTSNGLYLGCLELISEFDPFLAQHFTKYGNKGKGNVSYLSSDVCSEFITIMSNQVLHIIINEINQARYFALIIDSTPDASHSDQLAVVLRYVSLTDACATERLVKLLPRISHKSEGLEEATLSLLEELNLDIQNCRGQSYDNASNMSGSYTGLQSRIKSKNHLADYVPCVAHSLNLVGSYAAEKACAEVVIFLPLFRTSLIFFHHLLIDGMC